MNIAIKNKLREGVVPLICAGVCLLMTLFSSVCMTAARDAFNIWLISVMPALFPFVVCASLMCAMSRSLDRSALFFAAALSGAPSGVYLVSEVFRDTRGLRLSALCASACVVSPMFIIGTVAGGFERNASYILPLLVGHYGTSLFAYILANFRLRVNPVREKPLLTLAGALPAAISSGVLSVARVCGTIVFFMVLCAVTDATGLPDMLLGGLNETDACVVKALLFGLAEMTNGCRMLSEASIAFPLKCALYCFVITAGGACIMAQARAFADFRAGHFVTVKLLCAIVAAVLAYVTALFMGGSVAAFGASDTSVSVFIVNADTAVWCALASALGLAVVYFAGLMLRAKRRG